MWNFLNYLTLFSPTYTHTHTQCQQINTSQIWIICQLDGKKQLVQIFLSGGELGEIYSWALECVLFFYLNKTMPGILEIGNNVLQTK